MLFSHAAARQSIAAEPIKVYAAASLTGVFAAISAAGVGAGHPPCACVHAASSTLARQIARGAPADIYISANPQWMTYLQDRGQVAAEPQQFAGNGLAVVTPSASTFSYSFNPATSLAAALGDGWLAVGDPDHVPAGQYAKSGLQALGQWHGVENRLARAANVRAALALVVRGEAAAGIVYESDAMSEPRVRIDERFPRQSHPEIEYMVATVGAAPSPTVVAYMEFLTSGAVGAILSAHGFLTPP